MRCCRLAVMLAVLGGCRSGSFLDLGPCQVAPAGASGMTCPVPGWSDRSYDLWLPADYDPGTPAPVVLVLHGGGGDKESAERVTCDGGSADDPTCLHRYTAAHGYVAVFPDGTRARGLWGHHRSWNAGGGKDGWRCSGGRACAEHVDDVQYVRDLLDDLETRVNVDKRRIYATGLSNGGAMSQRLACDLSDRIAAVASVNGELQLATSGACAPSRPMPVLDVHATTDPCWPYRGGVPTCPIGKDEGKFISVARTLAVWSAIDGCDGGVVRTELPDRIHDGSLTTRVVYTHCAAPLEHLRVDGSGHTWPDGWQYLRVKTVGTVPRDWGNEVLFEFFDRQELPQ